MSENKMFEDKNKDLYVTLPMLIHDILLKTAFELNNDPVVLQYIAKEIQNVTKSEIDATVNRINNYEPSNFDEIMDAAT